MASPSTINFRNSAFEITNLTRIDGEPDFKSIRTLQQKLIINTQCVHSDLGGGAYGHLGLVISPEKYALHSDAAYRRPTHPGIIVILPGTTNHLANIYPEQHKERLRVFREVQAVEQALRQQIVTAIEPQYLDAFQDAATGCITDSIHQLIQKLFQLYG